MGRDLGEKGWLVCRQGEQQVQVPECLGIPGPALSPQPPAKNRMEEGPAVLSGPCSALGASVRAADTRNTRYVPLEMGTQSLYFRGTKGEWAWRGPA